MISLTPELARTFDAAKERAIDEDRRMILKQLSDRISEEIHAGNEARLVFICTHNSRRSQLAQIWATVCSAYYNIPAQCYSGGTEATAFNPRAVDAIVQQGFRVEYEAGVNPKYRVQFAHDFDPVIAFSKVFDDPANPTDHFIAVMTCSDADENCPFIPGAEARIPLLYKDPKEFDDTEQEEAVYTERSMQIASEMVYVFTQIAFAR